jgi:hypothetical protein
MARDGEGNSLPEDRRGRDKSGHGKKATEREELTSWRPQRGRQLRALKESDRARGAHFLKTAEEGTHQESERKRLTEGHSPTGDHRGGDNSGHGKKATERWALTNWRPRREGEVRVWKELESGQEKGTHELEATRKRYVRTIKKAIDQGTLTDWRPWRGATQDMKRKQPSEGHSRTGHHKGGISKDTERKHQTEGYSLPGHRRGRDNSGYGRRKKATEKGYSQTGHRRGKDNSGNGKKAIEKGALTNWTPQGERQVRIQKESNQARGTYQLASGKTQFDNFTNLAIIY